MANTVLIGCRLPHGIVLEIENAVSKEVTSVALKGQNQSAAFEYTDIIVLQRDHFGITEVDAGFWEKWIAANADFAPLKANAIFVAKDEKSAKAQAAELRTEATGFEATGQDAGGVATAEQ
jgi:hypothetical protein